MRLALSAQASTSAQVTGSRDRRLRPDPQRVRRNGGLPEGSSIPVLLLEWGTLGDHLRVQLAALAVGVLTLNARAARVLGKDRQKAQ